MKIIYSLFLFIASVIYSQEFSDAFQSRTDAYYSDINPSLKSIDSIKYARGGKLYKIGPNATRRLYGRHVCTQNKVVMLPVTELQSYCKPNYQSYMRRCEQEVTRYCTGYRVAYVLAYRNIQRYISKTESSYACCPGWTHALTSSPDCKKALCKEPCQNGGTCIKPNICYCLAGWTGQTCSTDIDECSLNNGGCEHTCTNVPGSYRCDCNEGFILRSDAKHCRKSEERRNEVISKELSRDLEVLQQRIQVLEDWRQTVTTLDDEEVRRYERDDRINSLSEQIAILEERLAECTCNQKDKLPFPGPQK